MVLIVSTSLDLLSKASDIKINNNQNYTSMEVGEIKKSKAFQR